MHNLSETLKVRLGNDEFIRAKLDRALFIGNLPSFAFTTKNARPRALLEYQALIEQLEEKGRRDFIATFLRAIPVEELPRILCDSIDKGYLKILQGIADVHPDILTAYMPRVGKHCGETGSMDSFRLTHERLSEQQKLELHAFTYYHAMRKQRFDFCETLLRGFTSNPDSFSLVNKYCPTKRTTYLTLAAELRAFGVMRAILEKGSLGYGETEQALKALLGQADVEHIEQRLAQGELSDAEAEVLLLLASRERDRVDIIQALVDHRTFSKDLLSAALFHAAKREDSAAFGTLVGKGADTNHPSFELVKDALERQRPLSTLLFLISTGARISKDYFSILNGNLGRDSIKAAFMQLVLQSLEPDTPPYEALRSELSGAALPKSLKSDAFIGDEWSMKPFITSTIYACATAASLADEDHERGIKFRDTLISNDACRIEQTTGLSWKRYKIALMEQTLPITDFRDVIKEVSEVLILPILVKGAMRTKDPRMVDADSLPDFQRKAQTSAAHLIAHRKTTLDLHILNSKWHRAGNRCPDIFRPYTIEGEWVPLFDGVIDLDDKLTIQALHTPQQLKDEGTSMAHCVGGYSTACRSGKTHILSIRKDGISVGTIELNQMPLGPIKFRGRNSFKQIQFKGPHNGKPSPEAERAFEHFLSLVKKGQITQNHPLGEVIRSEARPPRIVSPLEKIIGYDLDDYPDVIDGVLRHYAERVMVDRAGAVITLFSPEAEAYLKSEAAETGLIQPIRQGIH